MRKRIGIFFIAFVLALTSGLVVACSEVEVAKKKDKSYTVTYYYNYDGAPNNGVYKTDKVDANTAAKKPVNPTRTDDYTFTDWTTDAAGKVSYNFSKLVAADLKLYAQWKQVDPTAVLVSIDAVVTKQYKVGDTFSKSDITVTAKYSDNTDRAVTDFTYSPNPDMSIAGQKTITVTYGDKTKEVKFTVSERPALRTLDYIDIVRPTKRIYTVGEELDLTGLKVTAVYTDESEENVDIADCEVIGYDKDSLGDQMIIVTYGGKFKTFTVTVAYLEGIHIITEPNKTDYDVGDKLDLTGIVVTADYGNDETIIQTEYLTEGDFDVSGFDSSAEGDYTVTISYKGYEDSFTVYVTQAECTVNFVTGVAGMENPAAQTVNKYAKITEPEGDFSRVGYDFDGWFRDGEEDAYDFDAEVTEYFTLTAKWTAIEYDITYVIEDDEDGNPYAVAPEQVTYTIEDAVDLLDPTDIKEGYTFIGWYDEVSEDEEGNVVYDNIHKVTGIELGSIGEKTFYARIAAIKTFTVTFNYNYDETPITKTTNVQEGTPATALNPEPTRTGYNFDGWYKEADCVNAWDFETDTVTENVELFAKWNIAVYTVTFEADNGEEEHQTQQVEYNKLATKPANPDKYPYTFGGWMLNGSIFDFNTPITGDITLVANWWYDVQQGAFLHIRANDSSAWEDKYGASNHNEDSEWKVADVKLQVGSEFLVVEHGDGWDNWYNAQDGFTQWNATDVITVAFNGGNFKVTKIASGYANLTWTLYIKKDGWGISLVPRNANEKRSPAVTNNVTWTFSENRPSDTIFIAGTFTDGFKYHKAWSRESTAITVLDNDGVITFRHVYLKKNDAFKIVDYGAWLSGSFEGLDQEFWINDGYSEDIALTSISNGWYDIIYKVWDKTLKIVKYQAATISSIEVELRNPNKTYYVGCTIQKTDLLVRTVNTDGVKALISAYTINHPDTSSPGEKWFSVSYGGLEGWVKVDVKNTKSGAFLYILTNVATGKWEEKYSVTWQDGDYGAEWKVTGVKLQVGTKFLVVDYKQDGTDWYHSSGEYFGHNYDNIITIVGNGDNYEVTWIDSAYLNASWTMTIKLDGTYVYLELPQNGVEKRTPDGNGTLSFGDGVGDKIYIAGNFTDDFKYNKDWSTESTKMTVLSNDGVYVFRGVYLKQGDRFKIVNSGAWYGGTFVAVGSEIQLGDYGDIMLFALTTGKYDLVYNSVNNTLKIRAYAATTLSSIELTPPAKTEYTKGDDLDTAGMFVKAVYSNGDKTNVALSACTITGYDKTKTGSQTVTVAYQGKTKTFTVQVNEPQSSYIVTFDSKGGSEIPSQDVDYGTTANKPEDPTKQGYIFGGWFKDGNCTVEWNFDSDKVTSTTTLYAKWTDDPNVGYYLHILTDIGTDTWGDLDAVNHSDEEVVIDGVRLQVGTKFLAYKGNNWYHAYGDGFTQYGGYDDLIKIGVDGDTYIVTEINSAYVDAVWKLYVKKYDANSISIEISRNANENRGPDGTIGTLTFGTVPDGAIYIAGTFTMWNYDKAWSTGGDSVLNNNGVYTFRGVYLKRNDAFKIVDNNNWKGGNFVAVGTELNLDSDRNVTLAALEDGLYDIVYDSKNGKLTVKTYVPAAIASIYIKSEPNKKNYFKGEPFDDEGLVVTATDTDGLTKVVTDYTLEDNNTDTTGIVTVTVKYGNFKLTFFIEVSLIDVKFMDGTSELTDLAVEAEYNEKLTEPEELTKDGYTFGGWYKEAACTNAWDFDTDTVTGNTTLYAKWTEDGKTGIYLHISDNGTAWEDKYTAVEHDGGYGMEWKVEGVTLQVGTQFYVVNYDDNNHEYKANETIGQYGFNYAVTIVAENGTYKVTELLDAYSTVKWNLYIKQDNSGISLEIPLNGAEQRALDGTELEKDSFGGGDGKIYIAGNFTDDFKYHVDWSIENPKVTDDGNNVFTFHSVALKQGDRFKVVNSGWYGGVFTALDIEIALSTSDGDIVIPLTGTFDIVYDADHHTIKLVKATSVTLSSIAVTHGPDKTEYYKGQPFSPDGLEITATYSDGSTEVVTTYTLSEDITAVVGDEITVTVTYDGETATFTIKVIQLTVTFMDGDTVLNTVDVDYDGTVTEPTAPEKDGYKFDYWKLGNSEYSFGTKVTAPVTLTAEWIKLHTVTFDSDGGSAVTAATVENGNAVNKPVDPTKDGFTFAGWTLDGAIYDFETTVTGDITLVATWNGDVGTFLYYSNNGTDNWLYGYKAEKNGDENGLVIKGVKIYDGMQFLVATKAAEGSGAWLKSGMDETAKFDDVVTVMNNGGNFKVALFDPNYNGSTWDIYLYDLSDGATVNADGDLDKDTWAKISMVSVRDNTLRAADGTTMTADEAATATAEVYIRGNFTADFGLYDEWSSKANNGNVLVKKSGNTYTFRNVYLKKGDCFKIFLSDTNAWLGGNFEQLDKNIVLASSGASNIYLGDSFANGYYDIIFTDGEDKTVKIVEYAPAATDYITVTTEPTQKIYSLGEAFSEAGLVVTATDTDGNSGVVTGYTLSGNSTNAAGEITVTVTYDNKTAAFTITVNPFTVTYDANGGTLTGSATATVSVVNGKLTAPSEPTRDGYTFGGWFADEALTDTWVFGEDGDPVTGNITLYAKWLNAQTGTFLRVSTDNGTTWNDLYTVEEHKEDEWKVLGVKLQKDMQFQVVVITEDGEEVKQAQYGMAQYGVSTEIIKVIEFYNKIKVEELAAAYTNVDWNLYINKYGYSISLEIVLNGTEYRAPDGNGTLEFEDFGAGKIYIAGNFTGDFKYNQAWSTDNNTIVTNEGGVYTFHGVYLKQCDYFKIVDNGTWLGGHFAGVGTEFTIANKDTDGNDLPNIALVSLATGKFDIVYDSVNSTLTVNAYVPTVTTESIAITKQPTKTTYYKGEAFDATGLEVTATYSDGTTEVVTGTLSGNSTDTVGTITVTVTYDGKTVTFTITVTQITVTFKDGTTVLSTADVDYNGKVTKPADPTKAGYKFDGWTLDGIAYNFGDGVTESIVLNAEWIKLYTVTFDSNGGSDVDAIENVEHGSTITAPTAPTKDGFTFAGWTLNGSAFDFDTAITGDITLIAKWNGDVGTFLYYSTTPEDETSWVYGYKAEKNGDENGLVIKGVKLYDGMKFLVATKVAEGNGAWLHAGFDDPVTVDNAVTVAQIGGDFKITLSDPNYNGSTWNIYLYDLSDGATVSADGGLDKETWAKISLVQVRDDTLRAADGSTMTAEEATSATAEVYLRGNFTGGFGLYNEWSSAENNGNVLVKKSGNTYTFRNVYLKKGDGFKIFLSGTNEWLGGNFEQLGKDIVLADSGASNIYLGERFANGYYDIVFTNGENKTVKIVAYVPATTASIAVTHAPNKTTYYKGEAFNADGLVITATDTDGNSAVVTGYTLTNNNTNTLGTITVTVSYDDKETSFTIEVTQITVTFDVDGGSNVDSIDVDYNGTISAPTAPSKEGYTFGGWTMGGSAYTFGTPITAPITLTATWTAETYTITYVLEGSVNGTAVEATLSGETTTYTVESDTFTLAIPTVTTDSIHFLAWHLNSASGETITAITKGTTGNITLYAEYTQNATVDLIFNYNYEGAPVAKTVKVISGTAGEALSPAPSRTGYDFGGWYTDAACTEAYTFPTMDADQTVYAKWTLTEYTVKYTVTVDVNGVTVTANAVESAKYTVETPVTLPTLAGITAGYEFKGWTLDNEVVTEITLALFGDDKEITLIAKYELITYTVTFDSNGGSEVEDATVAHGGTVTAPTEPTKDGYVFGGWYKENTFVNAWTFGDEGDTVTENTTLYAKWNLANGTVLHYSNNGVDNWTDGYTVEKNEDKNEVVIRNVKLYDGMQFIVVTNNTYYLKSGFDEAQTFEDVVTVTNNGGNFKIALSDTNYNGSAWTIYLYGLNNDVTVSDSGDLDRDTWAHGMGFVPVRDNTLRKADGTAMTAEEATSAADEVYIRGNLTGSFGLYNEWSSAENNGNVLVKKSGNTYTFRNVYLKKGDEFKIYLGGTDKWYGGNFEQLGKDIVLADSGASNIRLGETFTNGSYDIIFTDGAQKTVKIVAYVPATTASIAVTHAPNKTTYYKGEAFNADGLVITATDTDGNSAVVTGYTLTNNNTNTVGTITVTVSYDDKETSFTIEVTQITVTFDVDGGSNVDSIDVDYNGTISAPTAPSKEGYTFGGWTLNGSAYTFGTPITAPITLTATWNVNSYDLTYVYDNGTANSTSQIEFGASVTLATAPSKDGYVFGGWSDGTTTYGAGDAFVMPAKAVTLTAQWGAGSYDLTYVYDNGTQNSTSQVAFGATVTLAAAPTKTGYTFGGWNDGTTTRNAGTAFTMPAKNVTFTAVWNAQSYTLKYVNGTDESTSQVAYGANVTLNAAPTKTGYTFGGWNDGTTTHNAGASYTMPAGNVTLTATWNEITYTVSYSVGGGTNGANKATYKITDADFTLVAATAPATYYFVEWQDKNGDTVTKLDSSIIALADNTNTITLTAVYSNEYTVTFSANGGVLDETTVAQTVTYGGKAIKPEKDPTRNSYDFKGWYTTAACTSEWNFATDTVTGNVTIYAGWRQNPKDGTFLYGTMTGWDEDFAKFKAEEWGYGSEWKITGITLTDGDEFVFVAYDADGNRDNDGWVNPAYGFEQYSHKDIFTVSNSNNNFKITFKAGKEAYANAIWTIFVKKNGSGISFAVNGSEDTNRKPDGTAGAAFTETGAADVYIMGNFTDGFKQNDAWSSNSTVIPTAKSGNKYYFANVYFKQNDALKIKMGDAWLGLEDGDNKLTVTADFEYASTDDGNIVVMAEGGFYDVVFDSVNKTLSITAHKNVVVTLKSGAQVVVGSTPDASKFNVTVNGTATNDFTVIAGPATAGSNTVKIICGNTVANATYTSTALAVSSIAVTKNPTKTVYKVGDTLDLTGIEVTVTNNDGSTNVVGADGLTASVTSLNTVGSATITVTVKGTSNTATFPVTVNALVVTFNSNGGSTVAPINCNTYNSTITAPTAPTKTGFAFGGWYKDEACTSAWNFATDKVTADITLHAKWTAVYTVTFDSKGGSAVTAKTAESGSTITAPTAPTRDGYRFEGWFKEDTYATAWNFATDTVTGNITLYAKWENTSELRLHILNNGTWTDMVAVGHNNDTEIKVTGVRLAEGTRFVPFQGNEWYHPNNTIEQYTFGDVITIKSDGDVYIVDKMIKTEDKTIYADVLWTLYIKMNGEGISLEVPSNANENRNPKGTGTLNYSATGPNNKIYLIGNFTNGYQYHQDWSESNTAIFFDERKPNSTPNPNRVTFRGVYLKKNDAFQIVYNGNVYGRDYVGLNGGGTQTNQDPANVAKIILVDIEDGFYNIVFSLGDNHWCRLEKVVIDSVVITKQPNKTTYFVGETFSTAGMTVVITDTNGGTHNSDYTVSTVDTSTTGTKTVTVTYNGNIGGDAANKKATFTITVSYITVTYNSQGGSNVTANSTVTYNSTITKPANPTKAGHRFDGWYKEAACNNAWNFATDKVTSNITLYAKWTALYTVTLNSKGGSGAPASITNVEGGSTITAPTAPTKGGYTFAGWYKESACQNKWEFDMDTVNGNITLYAKWLREVQPGTYLHILTDFTAEVEDDKWSDLYSPVEQTGGDGSKEWKIEGVKLQQGTKFLVVTYVADGNHTWYGANANGISQYTYNGIISIVKEGGDFKVASINVGYVDVAWTLYIKKDGSGISLEVPVNADVKRNPGSSTADSTLTYGNAPATAVYIAGNFTDGFKYHQNWSADSTVMTVVYESDKTRYTFRHVYLKKGDSFKIVDNGVWWGGDLDLTGSGFKLSDDGNARNLIVVMLEDGYYDIYYNHGNHFIRIEPYAPTTIKSVTVTPPTKTTYLVGEPFSTAGMVVTITDSEFKTHNTEYTITGNTTASTGTKTVTVTYNGSLAAGNGVSLSATFQITVNAITVTYNSNGGSAVSANSSVTYNSTIATQPTTTRAGYTFDGWYNGSTKWVFGASGTKVTGNVTLTAHWTIVTYNITYVVSDTTLGTAPAAGTYTVEQAVTLSSPTNIKSGYTFVGWYANSGLTGNAVTSVAKGSTGDKTFYAKIAQVVTVNLVFNYNYTGAPAATTVKVISGTAGSALDPAPTRTGYTFGGWYTTSSCTTAYTFPTMTANTTVYAKWTANKYSLTYNFNGNGTANSTAQVECDKTVTLSSAPTWAGHTFGGWKCDADNKTYNGGASYTMPAKAVTMTAQWTLNTYKVTFNVNGGSAVSQQTISHGGKVTQPANPTKTGYVFEGWYKEAALTNKWNFTSDTVTATTTIYAKWGAIPTGSVAVGTDTVYLVGSFGGSTTTYEYGFKMAEDSSTQHSITKTLAVGDMFAGWHKGWNMWVAEIENSDLGSKFEVVTVDGKSYIKVKAGAAGTYTLYCKHVNGGANQFWISGPAIQLEANSAAFQFKDATIVLRIDFANFTGWGTLSNPRVHIWKVVNGTETQLTGGWDDRKSLDGKSTYNIDSNIGDGVKMILTFDENGGNKQSVDMDITSFKNGKQYTLTGGAITGWTDGKFTANLVESNIVY